MEDKNKIANNALKTEASSQDTLPERLTELANINDELAEIVASNVSAPPELLKELAFHDRKAVKKAVVSNPNTPIETLFELAEYYPQEFLANPILDILFLEKPNFLEDINVSDEALFVLVRQQNIPKFFLQNIVNNLQAETEKREKVVEEAKLHVNYAGEMNKGWHELAMQIVKNDENFYYPHEEEDREYSTFYYHHHSDFLSNFKDFLPSRLFVLDDFKIHGQILDDYPDTLAELIETDDSHVKMAIAETTKTRHILEKLASDKNEFVRHIVAVNANTPVHILEKFTTDEDKFVRQCVAENNNTPIYILEKLATDTDKGIKQAVAKNANIPIHILEKLAINAEDWVRKSLAKNINTPIYILEKLAINANSFVRQELAENINTPTHILEKLVRDKNSCVLSKAISNSNLPKEIIKRIYHNKENQYLGFLTAIARNSNTPQYILKELSNSKYDDVKEVVANNKNTPLSILSKLADDRNIYTLVSILEREECPTEIEQKIFNNLKKIDFNKKIDKRDKDTLYEEINTHLELAFCEKCPIEVKKKIFSSLTKASESYFIAFIVLMSDYAKVEDLATYSKSKLWLERYAIAQNKKTPKETLEILAKDCNRIVRATAKESLAKIQYKTESP